MQKAQSMFFVDPVLEELVVKTVGSVGVTADDGDIVKEVDPVAHTFQMPENCIA